MMSHCLGSTLRYTGSNAKNSPHACSPPPPLDVSFIHVRSLSLYRSTCMQANAKPIITYYYIITGGINLIFCTAFAPYLDDVCDCECDAHYYYTLYHIIFKRHDFCNMFKRSAVVFSTPPDVKRFSSCALIIATHKFGQAIILN